MSSGLFYFTILSKLRAASICMLSYSSQMYLGHYPLDMGRKCSTPCTALLVWRQDQCPPTVSQQQCGMYAQDSRGSDQCLALRSASAGKAHALLEQQEGRACARSLLMHAFLTAAAATGFCCHVPSVSAAPPTSGVDNGGNSSCPTQNS